jgi:hypothetical protein
LVDGSQERDELGRCIASLLSVACFVLFVFLDVYGGLSPMPMSKEEHINALWRRVQAFLFIRQASCEVMMAIARGPERHQHIVSSFFLRLGSSSRTVLLHFDRNSQLGRAAVVRVGKFSRQAIIVFHKAIFMYVNSPHPSASDGIFGQNTSRPIFLANLCLPLTRGSR